MRRERALGVLVVAAALVTGPTAARGDAPTFDPFRLPAETVRLPNGLTVMLAPDPHATLVMVVVSYNAGSADDPDGLRGLAHLVEHVVFDPSRGHTVVRALELAGGCHFNATTLPDMTNYFEAVPPERLETALWLESERMRRDAVPVTDSSLDATRPAVANEERDRSDRVDGAIPALVWQKLFPAWHPYAGVPDGAVDLERIRAKDVFAFLRTWYVPENARLAIVGSFSRDVALSMVTRYFGRLAAGTPPSRPLLPALIPAGSEQFVRTNVPNDTVTLAWLTPPFGKDQDAALDLAAEALAGAGNERFSKALVATHLVTYVGARQHSLRETSVFSVDAVVAPGIDPKRVIAVAQDVIDDFARSASATEILRARSLWRNTTLMGMESPWGRAARLMFADTLSSGPGAGFDWGLGRYESLGEGEVRGAVAAWLGAAHCNATVVVADRMAPRGAAVDRVLDRNQGGIR